MVDFFLPRDDSIVAIQIGAVLAVGAIGILATRRRPEVLLLIVGLVLLALAAMGLRALH